MRSPTWTCWLTFAKSTRASGGVSGLPRALARVTCAHARRSGQGESSGSRRSSGGNNGQRAAQKKPQKQERDAERDTGRDAAKPSKSAGARVTTLPNGYTNFGYHSGPSRVPKVCAVAWGC
jgi:hypothetical protein